MANSKTFASLFSAALDDETVLRNAENDLYDLEVERHFFRFASAVHPLIPSFSSDVFYRGAHRIRNTAGRNGYSNYVNAYTSRVAMTIDSPPRFQRISERTQAAPPEPNQIAFALGRLCTSLAFVPTKIMSARDAGVGIIGRIFAHPAGRQAYFSETAIIATGKGQLALSGVFAPSPGADGHYILDVRVKTGDSGPGIASMEYFFRKRPWIHGCYEPGAAKSDFLGVSASRTEQMRHVGGGARTSIDINALIVPATNSPTPSNVPMDVGYPTVAARTLSRFGYTSGMAYDGLADGRVWWANVENIAASDTNQVQSRGFWSWRRMTADEVCRNDQAGDNQPALGAEESEALTDFPALSDAVRFNDVKFARNGWGFLAADGDDNAGTGADTGALIMFDAKRLESGLASKSLTAAGTLLDDSNANFPAYVAGRKILFLDTSDTNNSGLFNISARNSATQLVVDNGGMVNETSSFRWIIVEGVQKVIGSAVAGFYTDAGLLENNVTGVTLDSTETRAAAGFDRIWVKSRQGAAWADIDIAAGTLSAWTTITEAAGGGTFTTLATGSERGAARFNPGGTNGDAGAHSALIDHDSAGDVYWVSMDASVGVNRLNKVLGASPHTHTYYSLANATEGGAIGRIELGVVQGTQHPAACLRIHRRDAGDPAADDLWLSGVSDNAAVTAIAQISVTDFDAGGTNPQINGTNGSMHWPGATFSSVATDVAIMLHLSPDGSIFARDFNTNARLYSLEGMTPESVASGTGSQIQANTPIAGQMTLTQAGATFNPNLTSKWFRVQGAANAANDGLAQVVSVTSTSVIVLQKAGVNEGPAATFTWDLPGTDFFTNTLNWSGNSSVTDPRHLLANGFFDEGGLFLQPPSQRTGPIGTLSGGHINFNYPIHYQWSGAAWYRSRVQVLEAAAVKTAHGAAELLVDGVSAAFSDPGGTPVFTAEEYYTAILTTGIAKDSDASLTWDARHFSERAVKIVAEARTKRLCQYHTARAGILQGITAVLTDDPLTSGGQSDKSKRQLAMHQRRIQYDGANGTDDEQLSQALTTSDGVQLSLDVGADTIASQLRFLIQENSLLLWGNLVIELYSATAAAGPASWSLRATYDSESDQPEWILKANAARAVLAIALPAGSVTEFIIDLDALETATKLTSPATNDAMRHWKVVFKQSTGSQTANEYVGPISAIDATGAAIGVPAALKLGTAEDANTLANMTLRASFIEDEGVGTTATSGDGINVTLAADKFDLPEASTGASVTLTIDTPGAGTTTLDDASANFSTNVVGRPIKVSGAGTPGNNSIGVITARNSSTQIEYAHTTVGRANETSTLAWAIDGIAAGDFFRVLDGSNAIVSESQIDSVGGETALALLVAVATFAGVDWEVVRNADVRSHAGDLVDTFPEAGFAGQLYLDPLTGHIYPHPDDVDAAREFYFDEYVKIQRGR